MKKIYSAGIIPYKYDNDTILYLLLHYSAGHWDFPKGKIETGETKEEAALRELQEETGLVNIHLHNTFEETINFIFLDYDKKLTKKTVYFFVGKIMTHNRVQLSHEHIDFTWLPYKDALLRLTYKNAKKLLKKANKNIISSNKKKILFLSSCGK